MTLTIRQKAEAILKERLPVEELVEDTDLPKILHELRVHQIELELQNEELRRAQHELRATQKKYFDLYNFAPVGYLTLDNQGVILELNLTGVEMLERDRRWLIGRPFMIHLTPDTRPVFFEHLDRIFRSHARDSCELTLQNPKGTHTYVQFKSVVAHENQQTYCRSVMVDITERKQAQERLAQYMEELKRSNAELEQFAYVASHDLQEPLRTVSSYVQLLERRYKNKLDGDADEFIHYAVDGAKRMQTLINDLLALSRIGRKQSKLTQVDCNELVAQVLTDLQVAIEQNQATISYDPLPTITGDPTQLAQLFQNLLGNAIKFRGEYPPRVHISAQEKDTEWQFTVSDNGIGMVPDQIERVFKVFQRLHSRLEYPGTGIGLAICKKIIELHGGRIWAESQPGEGSAFHFALPQ